MSNGDKKCLEVKATLDFTIKMKYLIYFSSPEAKQEECFTVVAFQNFSVFYTHI